MPARTDVPLHRARLFCRSTIRERLKVEYRSLRSEVSKGIRCLVKFGRQGNEA